MPSESLGYFSNRGIRLKLASILVGIIFILIFALSSVQAFPVKVFTFSIQVPNLMNFIGSLVIYHFLAFDITVGTLILLIGALLVLIGCVR